MPMVEKKQLPLLLVPIECCCIVLELLKQVNLNLLTSGLTEFALYISLFLLINKNVSLYSLLFSPRYFLILGLFWFRGSSCSFTYVDHLMQFWGFNKLDCVRFSTYKRFWVHLFQGWLTVMIGIGYFVHVCTLFILATNVLLLIS